METFTIRDLTFTYPGREKPALDRITFEVKEGDFLLLCGKSGCGKSTLLRSLKSTLQPYGDRTGEILFYGRPLEEVEVRSQTQRIGYVMQSPDNQIVTDKVWHELAFGMENLGCDRDPSAPSCGNGSFSAQTWFQRLSWLSGGQKQILTRPGNGTPDILILDELTLS